MKVLLIGLFVIGSFSAFATESYLFECNFKAIQAAKAIDSLNFELSDRTSSVVTEKSQTRNAAKIIIAFSEAENRSYTVRLTKNRQASLSGYSVIEEAGCTVDSVDVN